MAKLVLFTAVVVALSAVEGDNTLQLHCQRELQESSLEACRQVVDHQLAVQMPFFLPRPSRLSTGLQMQCCQQLQDISHQCLAAAIRQIVRQYEHQGVVPLTEQYYLGKEEEQQQGGSYYPSGTYPQQGRGWERQHQQGQGCQAFPQQQQQQWPKQQQGVGSFQSSETFPQQQKQARQPTQQEEQDQYCGRQSHAGFGGFSSPPHICTEQQEARRRMHLKVVARARQVVVQLPAMCLLEGRTFSVRLY
ncbi:hypothetical protein QYE76_014768 [Lolium multiflorum]|uniref:Bifunctional inhibitor/plant lipid transfer protein/seed storage helical domain-containing protein n=1 Tax=Lolium multiflorum TaxID=4521 RepID=A0AAD8X648_LOLMU|nr:hypothetical protein QYE76_014768 [Lolium multiflorum]